MISRRTFLHTLAAGSLAGALPGLAFAAPGRGRQRLVLVILRGGLDGLAAVAPYGDPAYERAFAAAHEQARGLRLALVGDGARRGPSEALARELGIADLVEFTGWVPNEQVIERLGRADIGVAPYLAIEPFYFDPAKIIEYMAAGLAVLASDQGRIPDMVEDGVSGLLLPPGDEAALTAALLRTANDEALRERLGEAARQRAETLYSWPEISKQVLALCAEAARGG